MKLLKYLLILILFVPVTVLAQEFSKEYGKITKEEMELPFFAADRKAEAVVLFDFGKSYFEESHGSLDVIFEKITRIKIFSDAGLKWAEVDIPFYHEGSVYEEVYDIEASTYNFDNGSIKMTPFSSVNCHDEKVNEYWTNKKFALPDVKAGSVIEYKYKLKSTYKFNLRNWEFQSKIPVVYSEYEVRMIPFYEYEWLLQGRSRFDNQTSKEAQGAARRFAGIEYHENIYRYVMKNLPSFNDEEYITSINDYLVKIDFQLAKIHTANGQIINVVSTWSDLVKELIQDDNLVKYAKKSEKLSATLFPPDSLKNKSSKEKFDFILNYIKSNFNWNKSYGKYASKSVKEFVKDKFGNAADLNLFAIGLLNAAGVEAYPVIISTRDNGKLKFGYPYLKFFNYVLIYADMDGTKILSDATETLCPNDRIPSRCLNETGLLIKGGDVQWIQLQTNIGAEIQTCISIDSIGMTSDALTSITATGYDALRYRNSYGEDKKKIAARVNGDIYKFDESSLIVDNLLKKELPYILKFRTTHNTEKIGNKIYISPFLDEPLSDNPLKQNSRTYPIDMLYPTKRSYTSVFTIPDGYSIDFKPEDSQINNDLFELNYNIKTEFKKITVTFNYTFKKSIYQANDYIGLKYYFKEIVNKGNEKVVLVSNKPTA